MYERQNLIYDEAFLPFLLDFNIDTYVFLCENVTKLRNIEPIYAGINIRPYRNQIIIQTFTKYIRSPRSEPLEFNFASKYVFQKFCKSF